MQQQQQQHLKTTNTNPSSGSTPPSDHLTSSTATNSTDAVPKRKSPVTTIAKNKLRDHFVALDWPLNIYLPRGEKNIDGQLQANLSKHGLNKTQLTLQLKNYKAEKYGDSQIAIIIDADELEEKNKDEFVNDIR